jgi:hypothetical protein
VFFLIKLLLVPIWLPFKLFWEIAEHSGHRRRRPQSYRQYRRSRQRREGYAVRYAAEKRGAASGSGRWSVTVPARPPRSARPPRPARPSRLARPPMGWPKWAMLAAAAAAVLATVLAAIASRNPDSAPGLLAGFLWMAVIGTMAVSLPVGLWRRYGPRRDRAQPLPPEAQPLPPMLQDVPRNMRITPGFEQAHGLPPWDQQDR